MGVLVTSMLSTSRLTVCETHIETNPIHTMREPQLQPIEWEADAFEEYDDHRSIDPDALFPKQQEQVVHICEHPLGDFHENEHSADDAEQAGLIELS